MATELRSPDLTQAVLFCVVSYIWLVKFKKNLNVSNKKVKLLLQFSKL